VKGPSSKRRVTWPVGGPGWAFAGSLLLHVSLLSSGAWLLAKSLQSAPASPPPRVASAPVELEAELALPEVAAGGPEAAESSSLPPPLEAPRGGRHAPRPDLEKAGRGGERTSAEVATNLASSIDPIALERDPATARDRSQVARLRTASKRESRDDRRATPTPMELTFLATGPGHIQARRDYAPTDPARGVLSGDVASVLGSKAGGQGATDTGSLPDEASGSSLVGGALAQPGKGARDGREEQEFHASARVLFARPLVAVGRAAVPTETRGRPHDTLDSSQEVAAKVSSLLHASSAGGELGPGVGGDRGGGAPGAFGTSGIGSRSSPSGSGFGQDFADDPGFSGYSRALRSRLSQVLAKTFPDWAIEQGRGGHVIFDVTLSAEGKPTVVRLVRPSGVGEYDDNVLRAVRAVSSFGRLPAGFGAPAQFRVSWDAINPAVGRQGGGPAGGRR
jgi:TonB family protein